MFYPKIKNTWISSKKKTSPDDLKVQLKLKFHDLKVLHHAG